MTTNPTAGESPARGRVAGKVALISGAARGQGRSHAVRLAQEGADIIALDICANIPSVNYELATSSDLEETVRQVEGLDRRIVAVEVDVREAGAVDEAVAAGVAALGRLDVISAGAGVGVAGQTIDLDDQAWRDAIDVNLTGAWHVAKSGAKHIIAGQNGGVIVFTGSAVALKPVQNVGPYLASKHGLVGLTRSLALELASHRIRVNCIHPTSVDTAMIHNETTYRLFRPGAETITRAEVSEIYRTLNVLDVDWIDAVDISNALLFLASDEARYITGIELPVDAGFAIR